MDRAVADLTNALLDMAAPSREHVLDIGCSAGTTVLELAVRVGPGGHVLGADILTNPGPGPHGSPGSVAARREGS